MLLLFWWVKWFGLEGWRNRRPDSRNDNGTVQ